MMNQKDKVCFVLMPFKGDMKEVYLKAIQPACQRTGFAPLRVDELSGTFNINRKIIEYIFSSDAIVADLTSWNPNVFYEMGVAHAIDNKTVLIIQTIDKLPFDISNYNCIQYEQTEIGLNKLLERIVESLSSIEEWRRNPSNPVQDFKPNSTLLTQSEVNEMQQELQKMQEQLAKSVPPRVWETLQNELVKKQAEIFTLQRELESLRSQLKNP